MKQELLAPAGSFAVCEAVLAAGADAVYLGGEKFSARALAPNFSKEDILRALDLAHLYGRKIYLALNTLLKNREIDRELYLYIKPFYERGLDAIIVQDYGVFQFVKEYFPDLPLHVSTQMSVAGAYGADFLRHGGAKRIVPARELSLSEIRSIREKTGLEIECFVHGALCYCYSGQCLMSSLIGGRSGNRGRCAQPCRLPYQVLNETGCRIDESTDYPISLKDLCAADLIPRMSEAGVYAFKIEGRMRSLTYAAGVTRIYRTLLDRYERDPEHYAVSGEEKEELLALGNRNGFTRGYYEMHGARSMLSRTGSAFSGGQEDPSGQAPGLPNIPLTGKVTLRPGAPMSLRVGSDPAFWVTVTGETVQEAKTSPLTAGDVRERITKTGETPFAFSDLTVDLAGQCFATASQINGLRRAALEQLKEAMLRPCLRTSKRYVPSGKMPDPDLDQTPGREELDVTVCTLPQLEEALACPFVDRISLDLDTPARLFDREGRFLASEYLRELEEARSRIAASGKQAGFCFPYVFRSDTSAVFERREWREALGRFDVLWARSYDSLGFCLSDAGIPRRHIRLDGSLYVFSDAARRAFLSEGIGGYTASAELNEGELSHMENSRAEFTVYGFLPAMISAQCLYRNCDHCVKSDPEGGTFFLSDRLQNQFFIKANCRDCCNVIYNSRPLYLLHREAEIRALGFSSLRISLVTEDRNRTAQILRDYGRGFGSGALVHAPADKDSYTNGHFHRGVE